MNVLLAIYGRYIKHGFTPSPSFNIIPFALVCKQRYIDKMSNLNVKINDVQSQITITDATVNYIQGEVECKYFV